MNAVFVWTFQDVVGIIAVIGILILLTISGSPPRNP